MSLIVEFIEDAPFIVEFTTNGAPGVGVPAGGTTGQVLKKQSNNNFHTYWADEEASGTQTLQEVLTEGNDAGGLQIKNGADPTDAQDFSTKSYTDSLVVGLWDDRGSFDASGNLYPAAGGSGSGGAILKGDIWVISVAGILGGVAVNIGDTLRALTDIPGQTAANWSVIENNIGYVPENVTNKDASGGYAGLTLFKINFKNVLGTFISFFTNSNTAERTYTFKDRNGTIADDTDLALKAPRALFNLGASVTHTGTTAETILYYVEVTPGQLLALDQCIISARVTGTTGTGTRQFRLRVNSSPVLLGASALGLYTVPASPVMFKRRFRVDSGLTTLSIQPPTSSNFANIDTAANSFVYSTIPANFNNNVYLIFSIEQGTAGDVTELFMATGEIIR